MTEWKVEQNGELISISVTVRILKLQERLYASIIDMERGVKPLLQGAKQKYTELI